MNAFKIKQNFYYKNINNYSNYYLKKTCNTCIHAYVKMHLKLNTIFIIKYD